jgi:hypothetical protein
MGTRAICHQLSNDPFALRLTFFEGFLPSSDNVAEDREIGFKGLDSCYKRSVLERGERRTLKDKNFSANTFLGPASSRIFPAIPTLKFEGSSTTNQPRQ